MDTRVDMAGVVVIYYPPAGFLENLESYAPYLGEIFVIDNSPVENEILRRSLEQYRNCHYLFQGRNLGIAEALNLGAELAILRNYRWLLTMDQDSRFAKNVFPAFALHVTEHKSAGIISPTHVLSSRSVRLKPGWKPIRVAMTSGNLLNLSAYQATGPFHVPLFLDYVDYEYCLRLWKNGYPVISITDALLHHNLGDLREIKFLGLTFRPTNHSPIRRYYTTRNRLYMMSKYPGSICWDAPAWGKEFIKTLLFESNRIEKLKYMGRGFFDFLNKKMGPRPS